MHLYREAEAKRDVSNLKRSILSCAAFASPSAPAADEIFGSLEYPLFARLLSRWTIADQPIKTTECAILLATIGEFERLALGR